jgi:hypothetical protein
LTYFSPSGGNTVTAQWHAAVTLKLSFTDLIRLQLTAVAVMLLEPLKIYRSLISVDWLEEQF